MFGTSGKIQHDTSRPVTEQYTACWDKFYTVGKVLYNTSFEIDRFDHAVHHGTITALDFFGFKLRIPPVNEFEYFIKADIHRIGKNSADDFTIQINHYWSKAYSVYHAKSLFIGDVAFTLNPKSDRDYFRWHELKNRSVNHKIFRFLVDLKFALDPSSLVDVAQIQTETPKD
jgi:hypothetical protein